MPTKTKLLNNASRYQSKGRIGDALKVMLLAHEVRTIREIEGWGGTR